MHLGGVFTLDELLSTPDAALFAGLSRDYIALLYRGGVIDAVRTESGWRVCTPSLRAFLADRARRKAQLCEHIRARRLIERARLTTLSYA